MTDKDPRNFFNENISLLGGPQKDPIAWNLYGGLFALAQKLEEDNRQIRSELAQISSMVEKILQTKR